MNLKEYTPEILINRDYVSYINDYWTTNEFIYKNDTLISISIHELFCNVNCNKPSFKLISLLDEEYLELYFPFHEIKHTVYVKPNASKSNPLSILTEYVKCHKYIRTDFDSSTIVLNAVNSLHLTTIFKGYNYEESIKSCKCYKFSHSYYKSRSFTTLDYYTSRLDHNNQNKTFDISISFSTEDKEITNKNYTIENPIQYNMDLDYTFYKTLTD